MPSFEDSLVRRRAHVREQAAALAAPQKPHPMVMDLQAVLVDEMPVAQHPGDPYARPGEQGYGDEWTLRGEWATLPERFAAVLNAIVAAGPGATSCWVCSERVGIVDVTYEGPHGEDLDRIEWRFTALVWSPTMPDGPVNVLCEEHAPMPTDIAPEVSQ